MRSMPGLAVALLSSLLVSGCHYYLAEDDDSSDLGDDDVSTDDGAVVLDAGVIPPDASVGCVASSILPSGWKLVEGAFSEGLVSNQPSKGGAFTTIVDASAGGSGNQASQPFLYLDLEAEDGAAAVAIDDAESFASTDWDIALKRFVIRSNSGDSGPADNEVATVNAPELTFTGSAPSAVFADDDWTSADCELQRDSNGGPRTRFSNWYEVVDGRFEPKPTIHVVRLGGGRYAEIDILTYYGDEANPSRSGVYVLHWRRF